jgi:hypothetical protein
MKTKSHNSKWAMALCGLAFFSFIAADLEGAALRRESILDQGKQPSSVSEPDTTGGPVIEGRPLAPIEEGIPVKSGSFTGTVME